MGYTMKQQKRVEKLNISRNNNIDFYHWISQNWLYAGGLITQATAARLLKKSTGRIKQMITEQKIKEYRYENISFVSFTDVIRIAREETFRKVNKNLEKELKKLEKDIPKDLNEEDLKTLEILKNTIFEAVKQSENIVKK